MNYEGADIWNPHQFDYFKQGYASLPLAHLSDFSEIHRDLERIESDTLFDGETWDYKAPKYAILRSPQLYEKFAQWYVNSGLQKELFDVTGSLPFLANVSIIRHEVGIKINTPWHRDTWVRKIKGKESLVGVVHPIVKLYYYPNFNQKPLARSQFIPGSHRWGFRKRWVEVISKFLSAKTIKSNPDTAVLFDTSVLHRVCPEKKGQRSLRLVFQIYSHPNACARFPKDEKVQEISMAGLSGILSSSGPATAKSASTPL